MSLLHPSIDIICSTAIDSREAATNDPHESHEAPHSAACTRRAVIETVGLLASAHDGLHRDETGIWWTGDRKLLLAAPTDQGRWTLLNQIARALGFDA